MRNSKNICIVGAGFGGLNTAIELEKRLCQEERQMGSDWKIILIDKEKFHLYTPLLYEVATGFFKNDSPDHEGLLLKGICLNVEEHTRVMGARKIRFINQAVTDIDIVNQRITLSDDRSIDYGYLVMATGSQTEYFGIPGMKKNSYTLKWLDDALKIRSRIIDLFHASQDKPGSTINIVIGGAGFSGVELACEMSGFLKTLMNRHHLDTNIVHLTIIEAGPQILPSVGTPLVRLAQKRLDKLGVKTKIGVPITSLGKSFLSLKNGEKIASDIFIWTGGVRANQLIEQIGLPTDKNGRVKVNEYLQMHNREKEFALGDNCCSMGPDNVAMPPTAQIAEQQSLTVAHNIIRHIRKQPLEKAVNQIIGFVVPMGGKYAVAFLYGLTITGFLGYILRKLVDLKYFLKTMPTKKAFGVWLKSSLIYFHND